MKRLCLLLVCALAVTAQSQQDPPQAGALPPGAPVRQMTNLVERTEAPSYTDLNCSGFISKQGITASNYIIGTKDSPVASQFGEGDTIFLTGTGYQEGQRYSIVRAVKDPNQMEMYPGQHKEVAEVGQLYQDMGHVRVTALRGTMAIAVIEYSCAAMTNGDYVVPLQERQQVSYKAKTQFEQWPAGPPQSQARIVMAQDFNTIVGTGYKVYLNMGAEKGVKPGDYFRVLRSYDPEKMDKVEAFAYQQPVAEDTQVNVVKTPSQGYKAFPIQAIGEMVVLNVTPTSSTAMITLALRSINVGDRVELAGVAAAPSEGQR
jgi:hypothetical protein